VTLIGHLGPDAYRLNHLNTIRAPTVVLHGDDDPLVPIAAAHEIATKVPGAELRIIPGLGPIPFKYPNFAQISGGMPPTHA
jgi:pimeloyl-ACP methyl ester carboxylesterase